MKFCRNCGTVLQAAPAGLPPTPMMPGPMGGPPGGGFGAPPQGGFGMAPPPGGGFGAPPPQGGFGAPPPQGGFGAPPPQGGFGMAPQPGFGPPQGGFGMPPPPQAPPPSNAQFPPPGGVVAGSIGGPPSGPVAMPATCPRCGSPTQAGFAFCQQCGQKLGAGGPAPAQAIDPLGGTLAASGPVAQAVRAGQIGSPAAAVAPAIAPTAAAGWGSAVSVNRDGTDGERFPLSGEFAVVGRAGADISFDQDRFLGKQHARLEPTSDGAARVVPLDTLNGVYRKIDAPTELVDGAIVLAGREVLKFEKVDPDERAPTPLIRHGVALFGSPPREPWGRLLQMLPSGGVRDIRHLWDDEVVIGREDGDLVFSDDQFLSRRHATFTWDGSRATLNDLGSSNGTFIRILGPTVVKHGDHLRMGDQLFRIELRR